MFIIVGIGWHTAASFHYSHFHICIVPSKILIEGIPCCPLMYEQYNLMEYGLVLVVVLVVVVVVAVVLSGCWTMPQTEQIVFFILASPIARGSFTFLISKATCFPNTSFSSSLEGIDSTFLDLIWARTDVASCMTVSGPVSVLFRELNLTGVRRASSDASEFWLAVSSSSPLTSCSWVPLS